RGRPRRTVGALLGPGRNDGARLLEVSSVRVDGTFEEDVEGKCSPASSVVYLLLFPRGRTACRESTTAQQVPPPSCLPCHPYREGLVLSTSATKATRKQIESKQQRRQDRLRACRGLRAIRSVGGLVCHTRADVDSATTRPQTPPQPALRAKERGKKENREQPTLLDP
ncbi:MAG: hypothetical protein BJ554DRAFT_2822, partial [Olpidium bornovanus]